MKRQVILAIAGMGLLFLCGGCSVLILDDLSQRDETPFIPLGSTRDDVEAQLGKPVTVTPLPDGYLVAIYEYSLPVPGAMKAADVIGGIYVGLIRGFPLSLGLETIFVPYALYKAATAPLGEVTFTYGPDGRLLYLGLPPYYGPGGRCSGCIRERCRSEHPVKDRDVQGGAVEQPLPFRDYAYRDCVAQRLAIWGLE